MWKIIGFTAATLTMFSFLPQIAKVLKTRSVKDVSPAMIVQLSLGVAFWIAYGVHLKDWVIIVANCVTLTSLLVLLGLYVSYRRGVNS